MDDRVEAMRILSAGNTIMMLVLGAILVLQVSLDLRSHKSSPFILEWCNTIRRVRFFSRTWDAYPRGVS